MTAPRPHLFLLNERDLDNPRAGGAEVHLFEIFGRLAARGYPTTLICAGHGTAAARTRMRGLDVHRIGNRYTFYARAPATFRRLARGASGPAVLVENLCKLPFYGPWYSPFPVLGIVHHLFGTTAFQQVNPPVALATYLLELGIPRVYRGVEMIAVSPSTRDDLIARGVEAARVRVITNGLDHALYRPGDPPSEPLILSLGRVEPYKRLDVVLDALPGVLAAVPAARLVIVGRGDAVPALRQHVARLGLERHVAFKGFVTEEEKVALYQAARVFVNPSEKEGWGLTVLEANACGVPVAASDVPGLRDSVRHDETGVLLPYADVAAFRATLIRLLSDQPVWERLRQGALQWAARFSWDAVTDQTEEVLRALVAAPDGIRA